MSGATDDGQVRWEDLWEEMEHEQEDPLSPARGVILGALIGVTFWTGVFVALSRTGVLA